MCLPCHIGTPGLIACSVSCSVVLSCCHAVCVVVQEAEDVPESMLGSEKLQALVQTMIDTMRAAPGVGLAAPQIGVPLKVGWVGW